MEWYVANMHFCEHSEAAQELFKAQLSTPAKHVTGMGVVVSHKELCARWENSHNEKSVHIETENGGYIIGVDIEGGRGGREYSVGIGKKEGNEREKEKGEERQDNEEKGKGKWKEKSKWKGDGGKEKGKWKWKWKGGKGEKEKEKGKWKVNGKT